jgi:Lrp/AsnC family transcriptional regulator
MDELDRKILRELQAHPTLSAEEISKRVGLSHTPCWRRIKRLEAEGVILERAVLLDPQKLNLSLTVFANIKLKQHDQDTLEALENAARKCPEIVECFSMTGDSDYICRVVIAGVAEYEKFLKGTILHFPGVASVNSSVALKQVKLTTKIAV